MRTPRLARLVTASLMVALVSTVAIAQQPAQTASQFYMKYRVAFDKARTAAIFVRPSRELEEQVSSGRLGALARSQRLSSFI